MGKETYSETLISLAMLKVNADVEGKDYIEYLVPFVQAVLAEHNPSPVTAQATTDLLFQDFGLRVTDRGCELVLRRLEKRQILQKINYQYQISKLPKSGDIRLKREEAQKRLEEFIASLIDFAARSFSFEWTTEDAKSAFIHYLSKFSIECLKAFQLGTALPRVNDPDPKNVYACAAFIRDLKETANPLFEAVIVYVKGHMLANALICPDLAQVTTKFSGVKFYLDTPVILKLLDLQGHHEKRAAEELLEVVVALRGEFYVFEHTFQEVFRVIQGAEMHLDDPKGRGRIVSEARLRNLSKSDLAMIRTNLEEVLKQHSVRKIDTPDYSLSFQIDEKLLAETIDDDIDYLNEKALAYDVNSIRSVYALRKGKEPTKLEDANAVLVTSNGALARAAYEYGREVESSREVSSVITDFSLANIAWLKAPLKSPEFPRLELLASCYAAMEPKASLWNLYLSEIDKLRESGQVSADMHAVLRYSLKAKEELMNLTLGSEEDFSQRTVTQIIQRVSSELSKEKQKEIEAERLARQAEARGRERELSLRREIEDRVKARVSKVSAISSAVIMVMAAFLIVTGSVYLAFFSGNFVEWPLGTRIVLGLAVTVVFVWGILDLILGVSVRDASRNLNEWLRRKLEKWLLPG